MIEIPIVLMGHQDHGKSTLIGRLILDTGSIKESRVREVREVDESFGQKFELAHLMDALKEERAREMTMDTTRAKLKGRNRNYELIDVPGHGELIANMLTGAAGAEGALLMISIEEGIKEQTRQHLEIAKLLGINQLGVAVNKMDTAGYRQEAFNKIQTELKEILNGIGYVSENIRFFPVSASEGDNVVGKSANMPWYKGPTIMEFLDREIKVPQSLDELPLRVPIQDGYDELLIGRIESGILNAGGDYLLLPKNISIKVKSIKDSEGELEEARAGQNIGIEIEENLPVSHSRGQVIVSKECPVKIGDQLSGEIFWIEAPSQKHLVLECGTTQVSGEIMEPREISQGSKTSYKIALEQLIAFEPEGRTILSKIVLKDKGKIIGVGNIIK